MGILFAYSNPGAKLWSRRAVPAVCAIGRVDGMLGVFCQLCEMFIGVSVSLEPLLMKMHTLQSEKGHLGNTSTCHILKKPSEKLSCG